MVVVFVAFGAWSICGAGLALSVFMDHSKVQAVVDVLGRNGARVFFVVVGFAMIALGTFIAIAAARF